MLLLYGLRRLFYKLTFSAELGKIPMPMNRLAPALVYDKSLLGIRLLLDDAYPLVPTFFNEGSIAQDLAAYYSYGRNGILKCIGEVFGHVP